MSAGGVDFMRAFVEEAYGVPREQVIGLSYDFSRGEGEKEPLGEGGCPLVSGSASAAMRRPPRLSER